MIKRLILLIVIAVISFSIIEDSDEYGATSSTENLSNTMLKQIISDVARTTSYTGIKTLRADILEVIKLTPRHQFVPPALEALAYDNSPLPIGHEQTISQPFIVALMTHLIKPKINHKVLEVGTGSGYQAAILSKLVKQVFTIELIPELAQNAESRLKSLGYLNVNVRIGNGYNGWPEQAPFDGIIVTAGGEIPPQLVKQLKEGGTMIIPVNDNFGNQQLTLIEKDNQGTIVQTKVLPVSFVPLVKDNY